MRVPQAAAQLEAHHHGGYPIPLPVAEAFDF